MVKHFCPVHGLAKDELSYFPEKAMKDPKY
jgi:hypothetical protein